MCFLKYRLTLICAFAFLVFSFAFLPQDALAAYKPGDSGVDIQQIQTRLQALGYNVDVDGVYGTTTSNAVTAFQKDRGLVADGIIGNDTFKELMLRDSATSRSGMGLIVKQLISSSLSYQGIPYHFGGTTPKGFDCSGYVRFVFAKIGVNLPRTADAQYRAGKAIKKSELIPGDLVYFTTYTRGISHVGIYLGNNQFISATSSAGVAIRSLSDGYWGPRYLAANRVL